MQVAIELQNTLLKRVVLIEQLLTHGQTSILTATVHSFLAYHTPSRSRRERVECKILTIRGASG